MCQSTKIIYKNNSITNLNDLETFNHTTTLLSENAHTNLKRLYQKEQILLQNKLCPIPRRYTYDNMLKTQACLENLDVLEALKWGRYVITARKLLHKYLYSKYNLSACNLLTNFKELRPTDVLHTTDIIGHNTISLFFDDMKDNPTPTKSIRTHLNSYLARQAINFKHIQCSCYSPIRLGILGNKDMNISNFSNERLCLPVYQIPEFLLLFTFFDGRNFEHCISQVNSHKLPPFKKSRSFSEYSCQIVFKKFQEYVSESNHDSSLTISTIFRCDNIFLFHKLNLLLNYYNLYLSDSFLDTLIHRYQLSYRQVATLKETITNNIFKDESFIIAGLKSNYLDFMLPFDIFYQYTIFDPIPDFHSQNTQQFEEALSTIKKQTMDIWAAKFYLQADFSFLENGDFSILSNEKILIDHLMQNPFYKYYYGDENRFLQNSVSLINNNLLNFDTMKMYLGTSIN